MMRAVWATAVLLLASCGPSTYRACMSDAATKPTDAGVRVAAAQCFHRFTAEAVAQRQQAERTQAQPGPWSKDDRPFAPGPFDDLENSEAVPGWLARIDSIVSTFDEALGLHADPNRGRHLLRRFVQLLVIATVFGVIWYRWRTRRRRP
jgi:hypothetical protein